MQRLCAVFERLSNHPVQILPSLWDDEHDTPTVIFRDLKDLLSVKLSRRRVAWRSALALDRIWQV